MTPETRVRMRTRKAGNAQTGGEPVGKGVHLVKQFVHGVRHRNTRHTHWQAAGGESSKHTVLSRTFTFDGEQLTVNEPGLYYVYAQVRHFGSWICCEPSLANCIVSADNVRQPA